MCTTWQKRLNDPYSAAMWTVATSSVATCFCVKFAESEPYCHSILFVCLSVGHSATYSLPRLIYHNQIWSAGIYLSSDPCQLFLDPYLHTFGARGKNMQNFAYFQHVFLTLRM